MKSEQHRRSALLLASVLAIGVATLTPRPDQADIVARTPPWCLVCGELGAVDVLLNIVLFAPFGAALGLGGLRAGGTAMLSLGLSATVELLQALVPGRDPTISDLLTNTLGGVLGGIVAGWSHHLVRPDGRVARRLAGTWAGLWLAQTAVTAAMVKPSLPSSWYWGQLAPDLEQFEQFHGRVASASAGPYRIRIRRLSTSAEIRAALLTGEPLLGTTTPGDPTPGLAPIVSIFDGQQREIVLLGRWGNDLVYRLRTRSFDLRLRPPTIRLPGAFAGADTALSGVAGRFDPEAGTFIVAKGGLRQTAMERVIALNPQWGWSLLLPFPYAHGAESGWLTALWVTAWMLPLGYWSVAYRPPALGAAAVALVLGLGIVPLVAGLRAGAGWEWLAGVAGLAAGAVRWMRELQTTRGSYPPRARSAASP